MTDKKEDKVQVEVSTYNWGPCLIKLKILDDFKKILIDEAKKNEEDFSSKLAGQIRRKLDMVKNLEVKLYHILHLILVFMINVFKNIKIKNTIKNQNMR